MVVKMTKSQTTHTARHSKNDSITIEDYSDNWPIMGVLEITKLQKTLNSDNIVDIQHLGSTSIPNAMAKPIIDIYIAVNSLEQAKNTFVNPITAMGYVYWAENPSLDKLFFVKGMPPHGDKRTHHIHIVNSNSKHWHDAISFRDYLRASPKELNNYNKLKLKLSKKYKYDRESYTSEKNSFIKEILAKASIIKHGV